MKAFYKPTAVINGNTLSLDKCLLSGQTYQISKINYQGEEVPFVKDEVATGKNIIDFYDNVKLPLKQVTIKGDCKQISYNGYNILKQNYKTSGLNKQYTVDSLNIVVSRVGVLRLVGQTMSDFEYIICDESDPLILEKGKTYFFYTSKTNNSGSAKLVLSGVTTGQKLEAVNGSVEFVASEEQYTCKLAIKKGTFYLGEEFEPMVTTTQQTVFEPYVGLKPSPSRDFPQKIDYCGMQNFMIECAGSVSYYYDSVHVKNTFPSGEEFNLYLAKVGDSADAINYDAYTNKVYYQKNVQVFTKPFGWSFYTGRKANYALIDGKFKDVICNMAVKMDISDPADIEEGKIGIYFGKIVLGYPLTLKNSEVYEYFNGINLFCALENSDNIDISETQAGKLLKRFFSADGQQWLSVECVLEPSESIVVYRVLI